MEVWVTSMEVIKFYFHGGSRNITSTEQTQNDVCGELAKYLSTEVVLP